MGRGWRLGGSAFSFLIARMPLHGQICQWGRHVANCRPLVNNPAAAGEIGQGRVGPPWHWGHWGRVAAG